MQKRKDPTPQELAIRAQVERCRWQMCERMARQLGWNGRPSKRIIAQQKVNATEAVVDMSELAQGVYLLEVNNQGQLYRERVVKQ